MEPRGFWFRLLTLALVGMSWFTFVPLCRVVAQVIPDQYIVVFQANVDNPDEIAREFGRIHRLGIQRTYSQALRGFAARIPVAKLSELRADPRIDFIEPDLETQAFGQTTPNGVQRIGVLENPVAGIDNVDQRIDVDVAILDTGIDLDHPDLNVFDQFNASSSADADDQYGHGTHVAGIVGALDNNQGVVGVAPGVRLWAVKVLNDDGTGSLSAVIAGLDFVCQHAGSIEVANLSLGVQGTSQALRQAIQTTVDGGVVVVVAAGNSAQNVLGFDGLPDTGDDIIPAAYPEVITVSALADTDGRGGGLGVRSTYGPDDALASFSNYGSAIDLAAPGVSILSTYRGTYAYLSGTSQAAPHVTGAVALYIQANGRPYNNTGVQAVRQAIVTMAEAQNLWGPVNTQDPDVYHEALVWAGTVSPTASTQSRLIPASLDPTDASFISPSSSTVETVALSSVPLSFPVSDVNQDGMVDILDMVAVAQVFGEKPSGAHRADVNQDGRVDIVDLILVGYNMGKTTVRSAPVLPKLSQDQASILQVALQQMQHYANQEPGIAKLKDILAEALWFSGTQDTRLLPNYPNPFNPDTWFPYILARDAHVTLYVYNAQGLLVRRLDVGYQAAGTYLDIGHAIHWDGRNNQGQVLASGIYFVELHADHFSTMRRIVLAK